MDELPSAAQVMALAAVCQNVDECADIARLAEHLFADHHPLSAGGRVACPTANVSNALLTAAPGDAAARASAFFDACNNKRRGMLWSKADRKAYFNATWHTQVRHGARSCSRLSRFGAPFVHSFPMRTQGYCSPKLKDRVLCSTRRGDVRGDGGKTLCEAENLLGAPDCLVLSVGINDDTAFESHLHRAAPACEIIGMDASLDAVNRAKVPRFVSLYLENFTPLTFRNFTGRRRVSLLKLDCETCEFASLPAFVSNVCVDQIVVEVHRRSYQSNFAAVNVVHTLMLRMHRLGYRVAFLEANPVVPYLDAEYTLVRNISCPS